MQARRRWAPTLLAVLCVPLLLGTAPQPAQTGATEDFLTYSVPSTSPGATGPDMLIVGCTASSCRLIAYWAVPGLEEAAPRFSVPGELTFQSPAIGGSCDRLPVGPFDVALAFTETAVTGTVVSGGWSLDCGSSGQHSTEQLLTAVDGQLVDGACHFTAGGCGRALQPDAAPGAGPIAVVYDVAFEVRSIADDGSVTVERTDESSIRLACEGETCTPEGGTFFPFGQELRPFSLPGDYATQRDPSGDLCGGAYTQGGATSLTFTADGVIGSTRDDPIVSNCGGGTSSLFGTELVIVSSALVEGECWFAAEGCFPAESEDASAPSAEEGAVGSDEGDGANTTGDGDQGTSSRLASGDPAAPSVLSGLRPPAEAGITPQQVALAALVTVILVLLMTFPTSLLNGAIDTASERLTAWRERRGAAKPPRWTGSWWWAALGVLAAALISAFVDPQFGANPGSLRVLLSIALSFALEVVLGWVVLLWLMRRFAPGAASSFSFRPLSLLVVMAAVVFTRITGFEPGIVFGLVAGLGFAATMGVAARARTTLVPLAYAFALALAAWLSYGLVAGSSGDSFGLTLLAETLASLTVGGIVALPLALMPVKGLGGHAVWQADRRLWAACYGIGLFAFFVVLMPMPSSWAGIGWELWAWIGAYVAYAAVAVIAWAVAKQPWRAEPAARALPAPTAIPEAETPAPSAPQHEEIR